jgi:hypothetical protein
MGRASSRIRSQPEGWVAEIPAIPGCHALMLTFQLISEEYLERKQSLPVDTTEIVHA